MLERGKIIESFEIITFTLNNDINLEDNAIEAIIKKCKFFESSFTNFLAIQKIIRIKQNLI